jgi:hypothetical protein
MKEDGMFRWMIILASRLRIAFIFAARSSRLREARFGGRRKEGNCETKATLVG